MRLAVYTRMHGSRQHCERADQNGNFCCWELHYFTKMTYLWGIYDDQNPLQKNVCCHGMWICWNKWLPAGKIWVMKLWKFSAPETSPYLFIGIYAISTLPKFRSEFVSVWHSDSQEVWTRLETLTKIQRNADFSRGELTGRNRRL